MHNIIAFNPLEDVRRFEESFNRLFSAPAPAPTSNNIPIDVTEQDGKVMIRAAVPGIAPEELEVTVEKNVLTIKGEHRHDELSEDGKVFRRENIYGVFQRSIRLAENLNTDGIAATFRHGMVTVTIPRKEEEKPKALRIPVTTEG
ncbi:MAG: Hsp20/alpha crystallin family protein [Fimbriimonas sp.]|jgi:HSP20 family protein|nr:Hsp20/alpha crystallin family protein [Fimbriimonas sp.]